MNNRRFNNGRKQKRLDRIERKCDRILYELAVIRHQLSYRDSDIDGATLGGKKVTKPSYKTMAYFDTEKNAFRCFKVENLICAI